MLTLCVQLVVGCNHVLHSTSLTNLLGSECLRGGKILAVIVAKVIVGDDGLWPQPSTDNVIHQNGLKLCLARLEVVTGYGHTMKCSQLHHPGHKGVLRRPVDKATLKIKDESSNYRAVYSDYQVFECFRILTFSKIEATAYNVDGDTSLALLLMAFSKFFQVSFSPGRSSAKRSVFPAHIMRTLSKFLLFLKSRMSRRSCNTILSSDTCLY